MKTTQSTVLRYLADVRTKVNDREDAAKTLLASPNENTLRAVRLAQKQLDIALYELSVAESAYAKQARSSSSI